MRRLTTLLTLGALAIYGCATTPSAESDLKLYAFDCGMLRFEDVTPFGVEADETSVRQLIVPCYMIQHENGRLLWDGGLPSSVAETAGWHGEDGTEMRLDRTLADQLADLDLDMTSFDYAAFSHLHFDHVGIANEVKGATILIQRPEYEAAFADPVTVPYFDPSLYSGLKDEQMKIIDGDYDVFGDGTVKILSAPGHTPGHQALFIDLPRTGPLVLSGDLYHFRISRRERRVPAFNFDAAMTLKSMDRVEQFVEETGSDFWIEHDLAAFEQLKKAPLYYD